MKSIILINASEHANGNTARIGQRLLAGRDFHQVDLVDYKIYQIGQNFADDQFMEVFEKMSQADELVFASPVYWHDISAYLKTLIERISQAPEAVTARLRGKRLVLLVQGADPSDTIGPADRLMRRFCQVAGMEYVGSASTLTEVNHLKAQL